VSAGVQSLVEFRLECKDVDRSFDHTTHEIENKVVVWTSVLHRTYNVKILKVKGDVELFIKPISELRSVSCHMGSHSVTCHLTPVNAPHLNPSQIGRYSIHPPWRGGRLSWPRWLVTHRNGLPAHRQVTHPSTNLARCTVTLLIGHNTLPLRHTTNPVKHHSTFSFLSIKVIFKNKPAQFQHMQPSAYSCTTRALIF